MIWISTKVIRLFPGFLVPWPLHLDLIAHSWQPPTVMLISENFTCTATCHNLFQGLFLSIQLITFQFFSLKNWFAYQNVYEFCQTRNGMSFFLSHYCLRKTLKILAVTCNPSNTIRFINLQSQHFSLSFTLFKLLLTQVGFQGQSLPYTCIHTHLPYSSLALAYSPGNNQLKSTLIKFNSAHLVHSLYTFIFDWL